MIIHPAHRLLPLWLLSGTVNLNHLPGSCIHCHTYLCPPRPFGAAVCPPQRVTRHNQGGDFRYLCQGLTQAPVN